jgi:nucleoside-diphosphate-sugar epimerase
MPAISSEMIRSEEQLDDVLSRPSPKLIEVMRCVKGRLMVLGAGGKMGPTLATMARRAAEGNDLEIVAVSRFNNSAARDWLETRCVKTIRSDLLEESAVKELPDAANIIYLVGTKFGTSNDPGRTWVMNTIVPARVMERFPKSRIVALSTGNVYPNSEVACGGSREEDPLTPLGEYPNSAVGRERVFQFYSQKNQTPVAIIRLLYAVDLRYGVLVDIAQNVWQGTPIQLANGSFNCVWQGDANDLILRALDAAKSPATIFNLSHSKISSVRQVAEKFGTLLQREPQFVGEESSTALIANTARLEKEIGVAETSIETMIHWVAEWIKQGGRNLGKPTHFEVRDGKY